MTAGFRPGLDGFVGASVTRNYRVFIGHYTEANNYATGFPIYGDFNLDGSVDITDFAELSQLWLSLQPFVGYDLNDDVIIDFFEFAQFAANIIKIN